MRHPAFRLISLPCVTLILILSLLLTACGGGASPGVYVGGTTSVECAPFARALTGVSLSGAAAEWWRQAEGRYIRTETPDVGSLLVFRRSGQLPSGHVGVVSRLVSRRLIMVTQANWVHHRVTVDQPVLDVSQTGDWSLVRVWWLPSGQMGIANYATSGFIRPDHPDGHDRIVAATPAAVRIAQDGR